MANFIESRTGAIAVPTTNGPFQATSSFSQRRAAVAAGLGQYSWSGYVVNAEYGPRMRYGSVITTLELEYDEMDNGPRLCDPSSCRICVDKCPAKAIAPYPEAVEEKLGDAVELHARFDRNRCQSACFGLIKETSTVTGSYTADQRTDLVNPDCVTDEEFMRGIKALSPSLSGLQLYPNWKCALCLAYCPLGRWKERFFDTGLSKGEFDLNIKQISRVQDDVEKDGARTNAQLV